MSQLLDTTVTSPHRVRDVRSTFIQQYAMDTPVSSRLKKAPKPQSSTPEWEVKVFATPRTTGMIEGTAPDYSSVGENNYANKSMLLGRFQRQARFPYVSKEAKLMAKQYAVPTDPMQDNVTDKGKELMVDIESTILSDNESVPASAGSTASKTRSLPRWTSKDDNRFTDTATTPAFAYRTPSGSILQSISDVTIVTETAFQAIIASIATARKRTDGDWWAICQPTMKTQVTSWTRLDPAYTSSVFPVRRWNQKNGDTIEMSVSRYVSDFGAIDFMTSFWLDSSVWMLLLDMELAEIGYSQAPQYQLLPFDGASDRGMWDVLYVVEALNPQANGKIITGATR
jgi:hypothetical protein